MFDVLSSSSIPMTIYIKQEYAIKQILHDIVVEYRNHLPAKRHRMFV